jgi:hypothetical protein
MAYIEVDVDLSDFETEDLLEEVLGRIGRMSRKGLSDTEKESLKELILDYADELKIAPSLTPTPISTVEDTMKMEYLMQAFSKYSLAELEQRIPV